MEEKSDYVIFAPKEGQVCQMTNSVPKKKSVMIEFKPKILFYGNFDWGRCSIRRVSAVYINVMYICCTHDREIETPRESQLNEIIHRVHTLFRSVLASYNNLHTRQPLILNYVWPSVWCTDIAKLSLGRGCKSTWCYSAFSQFRRVQMRMFPFLVEDKAH